MMYSNEVSKIRDRVLPYLDGIGLDMGCYDCKVMPNAVGIDGREAVGVNYLMEGLYGLHQRLRGEIERDTMDYVFSSHVLEHLHDPYRALCEWSSFIKPNGYLILYLPDARRYNHEENKEHILYTEYHSFLFWFRRTFCGEGLDFKGEMYLTPIFELIESGEDPHEEDMYSFYLVAKKL